MQTKSNKSINQALQKFGGAAAIGMAFCYISMFIVFGAVLSFPQSTDMTDKIYYIEEHYLLLASAYTIGYLLFGCLLCVTIQAVHNRLQTGQSAIMNTASIFGLIWVVLMMCAGMAILIGTDMTLKLIDENPDTAISLFNASNMVGNALGGGIELVGGLWVLLLSIAALRTQQFSNSFNLLGVFVGTVGVLTLFHTVPYLKETFGLSQIIWFVWLGIGLLKDQGIDD